MKITIEQIKEEAAEYGWSVVSDKYVNLDTDMTFECQEGHTVFLPYKKVRDRWLCPTCAASQYAEPNHVPKQKAAGVRRILALDQASRITGYSIFYQGKSNFQTLHELQQNHQDKLHHKPCFHYQLC
mgnify:CR=1 FL=1